MVIDYILDRRDGKKYKALDFYRYAMQESSCLDGMFDGLTKAMDYGTEEDVRRELNAYIKNEGYNPEICEYIDSVKWLENDIEPENFDFCLIRFNVEDLKQALRGRDIPATTENIERLLNNIDTHFLEMSALDIGFNYFDSILRKEFNI